MIRGQQKGWHAKRVLDWTMFSNIDILSSNFFSKIDTAVGDNTPTRQPSLNTYWDLLRSRDDNEIRKEEACSSYTESCGKKKKEEP